MRVLVRAALGLALLGSVAVLFLGPGGSTPAAAKTAEPVIQEVKADRNGRVIIQGRNFTGATFVTVGGGTGDYGLYFPPESAVKVTNRRIVITDSSLSGKIITYARIDTPGGQDIESGLSVSVR